jgi:YVTN family beta-propeller protein
MQHAAGLLALTLLLTAAPSGAAAAASRWIEGGVAVGLSVEPVSATGGLHAGETVRIRFSLTDATGTPLTALSPGAWVDGRQAPVTGSITDDTACTAKIAAFVGGGTLSDPALNLNSYVVATLNDDATLSVLDPVGGFGGTRLLTMVPLASPAEDWALSNDQARLYAALPAAGEVAVIDTASWTVARRIPVPGAARLALEPGEPRLWVLSSPHLPGPPLPPPLTPTPGEGGASSPRVSSGVRGRPSPGEGGRGGGRGDGGEGLTAVDLSTGRATSVAVGAGPHRLAFAAEGRKAYVTNAGDSTLSVIDTEALRETKRLPLGHAPSALDVSPLARAAYVASARDGTVTVVDTDQDAVAATLAAEPGLGEIRAAPGGRYVFLLNPKRDLVHVIDTAARRIVQTGRVEREPDQVVFSETIAYVRHRGSENVLMIPLAKIGGAGEPLPVGDFPGGRAAFGAGVPPSAADGLARVPGMSAMLVANPADRTVYFYKEGMAAPMGEIENRPRAPRAVLAVDRSLRERAPGVYETTAVLPRAGLFDVAFFLPAPRLVHCFPLRVEPKPGTALPATARQVAIEPLLDGLSGGRLTAGTPAVLRARLTDRTTGQPLSGVADLTVALVATASNWSLHQTAAARADGLYELPFEVPAPGVYYVYFTSPSLGLAIQGKPALVLAAARKAAE